VASAQLLAGDANPPMAPAPARRSTLYVASLCLVLLLALSGAYLLWRDLRRDVQIAELRSQFVSSVSHELKTPLTSIRMYAETLRMRPHQVPRDEYLQTIVNETERLSRLVDNVLDFAKLEEGTSRIYQLRPVSLRDVVEATVRTLRSPLQQAGFVLRLIEDESLPLVHADPDALQQALLNLITNAMKYSGERKEIELKVSSERPATAVIAVRDYGLGIPAEYRQKIFERFFRLPSAEHLQSPGAGLGLTLVAHIVKAHGGDVQVDSGVGEGSVFMVRLPLMEKHA
jgi:signal transduction histidine kinase